jgi:hypothetical protein
MKKLSPAETRLVGKTVYTNGIFIADETFQRIKWLTSNHLKSVAGTNWRILFQDPDDGRYWELSYPQRHRYGDGPPHLSALTVEEAKKSYGI